MTNQTLPRLLAMALALVAGLALRPVQATELLMFERDGCGWCARWNREVGTLYGLTPEGQKAPLRRVNLDRENGSESGLKSAVRFTPTFVLVEQGREIARITGYMGEDAFWGLLGKYLSAIYKPGT